MKETFKHKMLPSIFSNSQDQGDGEAETDNLARRQSHVSTRVPRYVGTLDTKCYENKQYNIMLLCYYLEKNSEKQEMYLLRWNEYIKQIQLLV